MPPSLLLRATGFEFRHQMLLRQSILAAAFSTYLLDPDDVVWRFIRQYPSRRALEHFSSRSRHFSSLSPPSSAPGRAQRCSFLRRTRPASAGIDLVSSENRILSDSFFLTSGSQLSRLFGALFCW